MAGVGRSHTCNAFNGAEQRLVHKRATVGRQLHVLWLNGNELLTVLAGTLGARMSLAAGPK